ncbi:MAG: 3-isopropylmalate dehydratase large subunit, partial [Elusimicrobiota bacterium]|nr:3-isopropylmalate dehydratase large subunit [Elusimicrobiota bacterium]
MGQTITEKILAAHCGQKEVSAGEFIEPNVDIVLANDITAPIAIKEFRKAGAAKVFDPAKIVLVMDHFTPNKDIASAEQVKISREFAKEHSIVGYYEGGRGGIEHVLLPEKSIVTAGDLVIGADSHTCTYGAIGAFSTGVGSTDIAAAMINGKAWLKVPQSIKFVLKDSFNKWVGGKDLILYIIGLIGVDGALYSSMEFTGEAVKELSVADRFTVCNMAIEAGAKNGIFEADLFAQAYLAEMETANSSEIPAPRKPVFYKSDKSAKYANVYEIDCSKIFPQVAEPFLPSNTQNAADIKKVYIDQAVIGSCTN